jgi:hypothetical protein
MNRNELPHWINRLIDRIADSPMGLLGRIAALRMGLPAQRGFIPATTFAHSARRLLIAPVNYSEQGWAWARALERAHTDLSARNMAIDVPGGFDFHADLVVPVATYHNDPDWQRRQLRAAKSATHVLIEAEEPPFGRLLGRSVARQAVALLEAGVDVAFMGHGTDVRLPSRHIAGNPWSYFADDSIYRPRAEALAARNIELISSSGRPVFVSTPDLLIDLPEANWCPVVIEPARWSDVPRSERRTGAPLRVAHAPSVAAAKGTPLILPVLQQLAAEGVIELALLQGVPSRDMPAAFGRADVLLDQFRAGSYGVAACEAMAAGCIVVGQISAQVRDAVKDTSGVDLPIRDATPDTLEAVIRELAQCESLRQERELSRRFVETVHDGRLSAQVLMKNWISPPAVPSEESSLHEPDR